MELTFARMINYIHIILRVIVLIVLAEEIHLDDVIPEHYVLDLKIDSTQLILSGKVCIQIQCRNDVNEIKLHAKQNRNQLKIDMREIKLNQIIASERSEITILNKNYNDKNDILTLTTTTIQKSKSRYELCIPFTGSIRDGDYIIWYNNKKRNRFIIATNFERQSAFPCFDEPYLKATYSIQLHIKKTEFSYSNGKSSRSPETENSDWVYDRYSIREKLSPSQISFVVTNKIFRRYTYEFSNQWKAKFLYRNEAHDKLNFWRKLRGNWVTTAHSGMGPWFSFPKVRFIVVPSTVEINSLNWKLVLLREDDVTRGSNEEIVYKMFIRMTSQWFGGMISPDSWDIDWMYKGLVSYVAYLYMKKQPFIDTTPSIMWQGEPDNLEDILKNGLDPSLNDDVGVDKAIMLLRMVHFTLGEKDFLNAINEFIVKYKDSSAGLEQLYQVFDRRKKEKSLTWTSILETWEKKGYPLVTVNDINHGTYKLTQERFVMKSQMKNNKSNEQCWFLPVTYTTARKPDFDVRQASPKDWLGCGLTQELAVKTKAEENDWVIFNVKYAGLYRVKYDSSSWSRIVKAYNGFSSTIRAQLVSDAFAVCWYGFEPYQYAFKLLPHLRQETSDQVWNAFAVRTNNLKEILENTNVYQTFLKFFSYFLHVAFKNKRSKELFTPLGQTSNIILSDGEIFLYAWACNYAPNDFCRRGALEKFDEWMINNKFSANLNGNKKTLLKIILCTVLNHEEVTDNVQLGSNASTNYYEKLRTRRIRFFLEMLIYEDFGGDPWRDLYIDVVGCAKKGSTLNILLQWATMKRYDEEDMTTKEEKERGFLALVRGEHSFLPTLEYFYKNIQQIHSYYQSDDVLAKIVYSLASKMNADQLHKMNYFVRKSPQLNKRMILDSFEKGKGIAELKMQWFTDKESQLTFTLKE